MNIFLTFWIMQMAVKKPFVRSRALKPGLSITHKITFKISIVNTFLKDFWNIDVEQKVGLE